MFWNQSSVFRIQRYSTAWRRRNVASWPALAFVEMRRVIWCRVERKITVVAGLSGGLECPWDLGNLGNMTFKFPTFVTTHAVWIPYQTNGINGFTGTTPATTAQLRGGSSGALSRWRFDFSDFSGFEMWIESYPTYVDILAWTVGIETNHIDSFWIETMRRRSWDSSKRRTMIPDSSSNPFASMRSWNSRQGDRGQRGGL